MLKEIACPVLVPWHKNFSFASRNDLRVCYPFWSSVLSTYFIIMTYSQDVKTEQLTEPSFKSTDTSSFTQLIQSFDLPIQIMFKSLNGKTLSAQGCWYRKSLYKSQYHRSHENCEFWCQLWKYSIWFLSCRKMFKICLRTGSLFLLHQCSRSKQCKTAE